jgi:hypothetical protein
MAGDVIGREDELAAIEAFLAGAERGPAALVLEGEPGIGKTILWEAGVQRAESRSARVLACRGLEAEASLSFAGLSDLLAESFDRVRSSLIPVRRRALETALLLDEPGEDVPDGRLIGLALLDAIRYLAGARSWLQSTISSGSTSRRSPRSASRSGAFAASVSASWRRCARLPRS